MSNSSFHTFIESLPTGFYSGTYSSNVTDTPGGWGNYMAIVHTSTSATIYAQKTGVAESYICDRVDGSWTDWRKHITNSDLVFGTITSFSIPANSNVRKTVDLPGMGSSYRLFGYAKGSDWATVTAVYCNNNQAVLDIRNFAASAVNVSVDYTIMRK